MRDRRHDSRSPRDLGNDTCDLWNDHLGSIDTGRLDRYGLPDLWNLSDDLTTLFVDDDWLRMLLWAGNPCNLLARLQRLRQVNRLFWNEPWWSSELWRGPNNLNTGMPGLHEYVPSGGTRKARLGNPGWSSDNLRTGVDWRRRSDIERSGCRLLNNLRDASRADHDGRRFSIATNNGRLR